MHNDLIPNISRHFLYSILEHNHENKMAIIENVAESKSSEICEFLFSFENCIATYLLQLEVGLEGYDSIRIQTLNELKNPHEENWERLN
ncbi:hypothetical protein [Candidatus Nitrosopumilus sediminis]|uniref:Uncharacterized protein n=1 Tax=Candidatus Nitrosopumilus sediminis TaxID=1229909 RepID=K0BGJ6_9ARCH|nr:hypothetical protein [Candidatus Nitrosopumilus sediminis]AFS83376.1 hypothetical protein NSED_07920 [Candidatus Nitrosopumilus sediminis]